MLKALIFDLNGTLIHIRTDEYDPLVYRTTANFLALNGIFTTPEEIKESYFSLNRKQREKSPEKFPEFDVVKIFQKFTGIYGKNLALAAARVFRAAACSRLELYPGVMEVLEYLQKKYRFAAVSDGQSAWAVREMNAVGLQKFFPWCIVSGDFGFRKPDRRMFDMALLRLHVDPEESVYIGNDMYRDVYGAACAGMKTVFFRSGQGDDSWHGKDPDYVISDFRELPQAVEFLENRTAG